VLSRLSRSLLPAGPGYLPAALWSFTAIIKTDELTAHLGSVRAVYVKLRESLAGTASGIKFLRPVLLRADLLSNMELIHPDPPPFQGHPPSFKQYL